MPVLLALSTAGASAADEFVTADGPMSDNAFYRAVSCGAEPGGACRKPVLRWPQGAILTVGCARIDRAFLGGKQNRARAALTRALQHINASGAALALRRGDTEPDIAILLIDADARTLVRGTGLIGLDGTSLPVARVLVWADAGTITRARIAIGTTLPMAQYEAVLLEELTQALGLLTDIRNPAYQGVSVFSQDSNAAKTLGPQDIMALRRHYPNRE